MRKVYHTEKSLSGVAMAVILGVGITGVLFGIIPFSHIIAKPKSLVQLRTATTTDLPPQAENDPPPPVAEPEKPAEAPPELQLTEAPQAVPLSADLEIATGGGGALAGFGEVRVAAAAESAREDVFDVSELEKRPEPVSQAKPEYPAELRKARIEGSVTLLCLVTAEGRVEDVRVENSSRPEFEKPAIEALRKWRFRPGKKDGQDVGAYLRYPISFRVSTR